MAHKYSMLRSQLVIPLQHAPTIFAFAAASSRPPCADARVRCRWRSLRRRFRCGRVPGCDDRPRGPRSANENLFAFGASPDTARLCGCRCGRHIWHAPCIGIVALLGRFLPRLAPLPVRVAGLFIKHGLRITAPDREGSSFSRAHFFGTMNLRIDVGEYESYASR